MSEAVRLRITGRVQGVGFRHFTTTTARDLGLAGGVRNEPDGSVVLEAAGDADALDRLRRAVEKGPVMARVERVREERLEVPPAGDGFVVKR